MPFQESSLGQTRELVCADEDNEGSLVWVVDIFHSEGQRRVDLAVIHWN